MCDFLQNAVFFIFFLFLSFPCFFLSLSLSFSLFLSFSLSFFLSEVTFRLSFINKISSVQCVFSSSMLPVKLPFTKQSYIVICVVEYVNHYCLTWMQVQQFCSYKLWTCPFLLSNCTSDLLVDVSFHDHCHQIFPRVACIFCMFLYCLEWNLLSKTFSHICEWFSCLEQAHQETYMNSW